MNLKYQSYNLPFKHPFTISKGSKTHQPTLIVELEHFGIKGYGEAPAINYYNITVEKMIEDIVAKKSFIEKFSFTDPERYWHYLHHLLPQNPFLVSAFDMAGWDLFGKMKRKKLHELWALNIEESPLTDFTIGIDSIDKMIAKLKETPWPVYKIKLGTGYDVEIITELRTHTDSMFRVDANASWKVEEALEKINAMKGLGVELIEQPLARDDWEGMKFLFDKSPIPLFADESCVHEKDVEKCNGYFHGVNIKLTKCGGITPARRMINKAKELGLQIMLGCMNESTVGSAAVVHLSPLADYIDVDGPLLLSKDIATGLDYKKGKVLCSEQPGLGITPIAPL
jgi:L-alanine-DL-glutamate epimerase-like enolase superfamily enzyme